MKQHIRDGRQMPFFPVIKRDLECLQVMVQDDVRIVGLAAARSVYCALLEMANDQRSDRVAITRKEIAGRAGVSPRTVSRAITVMVAAGLVTATETNGTGCVWTLCSVDDPLPLWQGSRGHPCHSGKGLAGAGDPAVNDKEATSKLQRSATPQENSKKGEVAEVFEHWKKILNHARAVLDAPRRRLIEVAIDRYGVADCKRAIDGCYASDYHMRRGQYRDRDGVVYDGIDLIFRNAEKTEDFIKRAPSSSLAGRGLVGREQREKFMRLVIKSREQVRRGYEHRHDDHWREEGRLAAAWLRENGYTVTYDEQNLQPPIIKESTS